MIRIQIEDDNVNWGILSGLLQFFDECTDLEFHIFRSICCFLTPPSHCYIGQVLLDNKAVIMVQKTKFSARFIPKNIFTIKNRIARFREDICRQFSQHDIFTPWWEWTWWEFVVKVSGLKWPRPPPLKIFLFFCQQYKMGASNKIDSI